MDGRKHCYVSGAYGALGKSLILHLGSMKDIEIHPLTRDQNDSYMNDFKRAVQNLNGSNQYLIHCGWDTKDRTWKTQQNCLTDTVSIANFCASKDIKMIFISSQSVFSMSNYGRSKLAAEQGVARAEGIIVRPGFIIFDNPSELQKSINLKLPSWMGFKTYPRVYVKTISEKCVTEALTNLIVLDEEKHEVIDLYDYHQSIESMMIKDSSSIRLTVPIPLMGVSFLLRWAGKVSPLMRSLHDSFLGLTNSR